MSSESIRKRKYNSIHQLTHRQRLNNPHKLTMKQKILSRQVEDPIIYKKGYYVINDYEGYNNKVRLLTGNDLHRIKPGIYTWIIGIDNFGKTQLFFKECFSMHEINSKHATIVNEAMDYNPLTSINLGFKSRYNRSRQIYKKNASGTLLDPFSNINPMTENNPIVSLLYSGEMKYDGKTILLNMYSGTYMYDKFKYAAGLNASNNVIKIFKSYLKYKIIPIEAVDYTFMMPDNFDPKTILTKLLSLGVDILKFKNKDEYLDMKRHLNNLSPIKSINNNYSVNNRTSAEERNRFGISRVGPLLKFNNNENNFMPSTPPKSGLFFESFNKTPTTPKRGKTLFSNFNN